jgi:hypothetical protein
MIEGKRIPLVLLAMALLTGPMMRGAEPNAVTTPLTFEVSPVELTWPAPGMPTVLSPAQENLRPTHAAGLTLRWPRSVDVPNNWSSFLNHIKRQGMASFSKNQQTFLQMTAPAQIGTLHRGRWSVTGEKDDPDYYGVLLYAVSEADAREMAAAYLRFVREKSESSLKYILDEGQQWREKIAAAKKRLPELEGLLKNATNSLEELRKMVPYRTNEEALAAIGELNRMVNVARVDIAGITAKVEAIQGYPPEKRTPAVVAKLEVMFVEEAVALRAAEARKREATDLRTQAARFIDLNDTIRKATEERRELTGELDAAPRILQRQQEVLAQAKEREPNVPDNEAFIYPVQQPPEISSMPEIYGQPKPKTAQP